MMMRRRLGTTLSAVLLIAGLISVHAALGQESDIRTQAPEFGGYSLSAAGAPISIEFHEPVIPVPTDPGEPQFEITPQYTNSRLDVGPTSRAVASSIWPGPALGDGFATVCQCEQSYPIRADARYPEEPHQSSQTIEGLGAGMTASALGLDVRAEASTGKSNAPTVIDFSNMNSLSESVVADGISRSTFTTQINGLKLLEGLITIDNVRTGLVAESNGKEALTRGTTTISGLTIAGQGYRVDQNGLTVVQEEQEGGDGGEDGGGEDDGGDGSGGGGNPIGDLLGSLISPSASAQSAEGPGDEDPVAVRLKQLGIEITGLAHTEEVSGANAKRWADGLRISIDTQPLRELLDTVPLNEVVTQIPSDNELTAQLKAQLFLALQLSPRIDIIIGKGKVVAGATQPISTDFALPPPPPPPSTGGVGGVGTSPGTSGGFSAPGSSGSFGAPSGGSSGQPPSVAPPASGQEPLAPAVAAGQVPDLFGGISPMLLVLGLALAGAGANGLRGLTGSAMMGAGIGGGCASASRSSLPDLRGLRGA